MESLQSYDWWILGPRSLEKFALLSRLTWQSSLYAPNFSLLHLHCTSVSLNSLLRTACSCPSSLLVPALSSDLSQPLWCYPLLSLCYGLQEFLSIWAALPRSGGFQGSTRFPFPFWDARYPAQPDEKPEISPSASRALECESPSNSAAPLVSQVARAKGVPVFRVFWVVAKDHVRKSAAHLGYVHAWIWWYAQQRTRWERHRHHWGSS